MSPAQDLVNGGFCLAEPGNRYLVYLESRGAVNISIIPGKYSVQWVNAQDTNQRIRSKPTTTGRSLKSPDNGDDWLVYLERIDASSKYSFNP